MKPADVFVLCGLLAHTGEWTYRSLAGALGVPLAVVQRALERADAAGLYGPERRRVEHPHFEDFAVHALRYVAPAELGAVVSGVPAAWAAMPVAAAIKTAGDDPPPVWPDARGRVRGQALEPLHQAAATAIEQWPELAEWLAVADSLRAGDPRVRQAAAQLLDAMLRDHAAAAKP